ncbi:Maestro heat-like repeat-containing protein family member 1 [Liparis tanakae]|uniref:Maestro heat-like repeat-containing protein family member 1 n=1 Tax=Liparis tanakae TaxID=230148 RepID=A0A4Z2F2U0_9TELE|nr:Maestro heat-like repeat-containing protein family member 1 [Liparis tanakae]
MCDNTLHLLTTTVGQLADVLWPKLLYFLTPSQFSNATAPLCKSLIVLGSKKKTSQEPSFHIDFAQEVNLPSPQLLLVRLLLNAAFPFSCRGHGAPSLSLLQILSVNIHPKTEALWETEIPPLLSVLEGSTPESLDKKQWDEKLLKLLSDTLTTADDDKWACQLSAEATRYLSTYNNALEEKSFLYRCVGTTLQRCCNKELVKKQLQEVLVSARHSDAVEREGVALAVGLCANSHLDATLAKLEEFGKSDAFKKSPSIFNLLKERNDVEVEKVKSTLILCYGQVAFNAPPDQILTRMDQDVLRCISKHFNTKDFIKAEPADAMRTPVRHLVMTACANLMYPSSPAALYRDTLAALQELLRSVLAKDPTPDGLQRVFKVKLLPLVRLHGVLFYSGEQAHVESWLSSGQDHERERAVTVTAHLLAYYLDNLTVKIFALTMGEV